MAYIKLDNNIVDSSLLAVGGFERLGIWTYLLSKADMNGWATITLPAIATAGRISVDAAAAHLDALAAPDPYSRTPDDEGRRVRIQREPEWGIQIVNYQKNREKDHTGAARQKRWRERQKEPVTRDVTAETSPSRKTKGKGQRAKDVRGEPTVPHTPPYGVVAEELVKLYIHNFNWCTGRACQATSEVTKKLKAALKGGTKPDEILCFPFIHAELNQRRKEKHTLQPDWMLRDGSRGTHNWIGQALREADGLDLSTRLSNVAGVTHMIEKLRALGVKVSPTKEPTNG